MIIAIFIILFIFLGLFLLNKWQQRKLLSCFKRGNVLISGLRGRGKDVAFSFVINKRKQNYISNINYSSPKAKYKCFPFTKELFELGGNTYKDLKNNDIKPYNYPMPDGIDYYISDSGVYYPAQYATELVKNTPSAPLFIALSRHLGDCNIHCNAQNQNRIWDKIREQSDQYVVMTSCHFIPFTKIFFLAMRIYSLEESAEKQIIPPRFGLGKTAKEARYNFEIAHGKIQRVFFVSRLKYKYDSRAFKKILLGYKDENSK